MKIHESMNVFLLRKVIFRLLLPVFAVIIPGGIYAQSQGLDVYNFTMLKDGTLDLPQFQHWQISIAPKVEKLPKNGNGYFSPSSCCNGNGRFGIKGFPANNTVQYKPNPGFVGRDTLAVYYYRQIGNGNSIGAYKVYNILVVPSFLYAENDYASTNTGENIEIDVLANDFGNGTNLTIAEIPNINNGTAVKTNNGTKILFTPFVGFKGVAQLNYTICDAQGSCDMATVSICVNEMTPPAYDSLNIVTVKNIPQVVLADLGGNFVLTSPPLHGALESMETLVYVPDQDYVGYDKMVFQDPTTNSKRVIQIRVLDYSVVSNTYLNDDVFFTPLNGELEEIHLLANDNGGQYLSNVGAIGYPNTANGGQLVYLSTIGKGVYKYTPPPNFEGIDKFTYKASPPNSSFAEYATCYIVVSNQNPVKPVFNLITPKNTPLVLGDYLPFLNYAYTNISGANKGNAQFHPGYQTVLNENGQQFSGYNMLVYSPTKDVLGVDEFEFNYCPDSDASNCSLIKVVVEIVNVANPQEEVLCAGRQCVWAGDANHDGAVDVRDILPIGLCMGEVGLNRQNGSISWYGQYSNNWSDLFGSLGFNAKHIDTDGNGIISSSDTTAIKQFYGKFNNISSKPVAPINELPFYIEEPDFTDIQPGDVLYAPIHLGNDVLPAMDAYGLTFSLDYDPAFFKSVRVLFDETSWMSYNSPILSMSHKPVSGKIDAGYTRTSGVAASGYGRIGVVEFIVIDDITGGRLNSNSTQINFVPSGIMNGSGQVSGMAGNSINFKLNLNADSEADNIPIENQLKVFPNPASDHLLVHLNGPGNKMDRVQLFNVVGQKVYDSGAIDTKHFRIDFKTESLGQGFYLMKVWSNGEVLNSKVEILKK